MCIVTYVLCMVNLVYPLKMVKRFWGETSMIKFYE